MESQNLVVAEARRAGRQPQLVQRESLLHPNGEREGHDLEIQASTIAWSDLVESKALISRFRYQEISPRSNMSPSGQRR